MLQCGGRRLEDVRELWQEKPLMRLVDPEMIPGPTRLGIGCAARETRITTIAGLAGLGQVRDMVNHRILRRDPISDYTLFLAFVVS
jgi:hypothetical protein